MLPLALIITTIVGENPHSLNVISVYIQGVAFDLKIYEIDRQMKTFGVLYHVIYRADEVTWYSRQYVKQQVSADFCATLRGVTTVLNS